MVGKSDLPHVQAQVHRWSSSAKDEQVVKRIQNLDDLSDILFPLILLCQWFSTFSILNYFSATRGTWHIVISNPGLLSRNSQKSRSGSRQPEEGIQLEKPLEFLKFPVRRFPLNPINALSTNGVKGFLEVVLTVSVLLSQVHWYLCSILNFGSKNVVTMGTEQSFNTRSVILKLLNGLRDFGGKHDACLMIILVSLNGKGLSP